VQTGDIAAGKNANTTFFPLKSSKPFIFSSGSGNLKSGALLPTSSTFALAFGLALDAFIFIDLALERLAIERSASGDYKRVSGLENAINFFLIYQYHGKDQYSDRIGKGRHN
jgi:hypothetical protein